MIAKEVSNKERLAKAAVAIESLETSTKHIPVGYLRMELSTQGNMGAPKVFHIRNFDTREIVELSMTSDSELPLKLAGILDSMIYEEGVSINNFHENEVIELIVKIFAIFYDQTIELNFPWNDEDIKFLEEAGSTDLIENLKTGAWKPRVIVDLAKLDFYEIDPAKLKKVVDLTSKKTGFQLKFSYPKYGDVVVTKKYLDVLFKDKDPEIKDILKKLEIRKKVYETAEAKNIEVNSTLLPYISQEEIEKYTEYETDRALFAVDLVRALHLEFFDGKDLSEAPLKDKIDCISDPRVNHNITKVIEKEFKKMEFGIVPDIEVVNPITKKSCKRGFLFRIMDLLQAILEYESDEYDVGYE